MVVKRQKKNRRLQGRRTMGWGLVHRGKGQRGGSGKAGQGKRSKARKPSFWDDPVGQRGFVKHGAVLKEHPINLRGVAQLLPQWTAEGLVKHEADTTVIDLHILGYTKLLGTGKITQALSIRVPRASASAVKKVEAAKGSVSVEAKAAKTAAKATATESKSKGKAET